MVEESCTKEANMVVNKVIGNLKDSSEFKGKPIFYVDIDWHDVHKKIQRKNIENGIEIGMRFEDGILIHGLRQDDVLYMDDQMVVAVNIPECAALVIHVEDIHLLPKVCYEIGNKHMPFFKGNGHYEFITPYDAPLEVLLQKLGAKVTKENVSLDLSRAISSSLGGHHH